MSNFIKEKLEASHDKQVFKCISACASIKKFETLFLGDITTIVPVHELALRFKFGLRRFFTSHFLQDF